MFYITGCLVKKCCCRIRPCALTSSSWHLRGKTMSKQSKCTDMYMRHTGFTDERPPFYLYVRTPYWYGIMYIRSIYFEFIELQSVFSVSLLVCSPWTMSRLRPPTRWPSQCLTTSTPATWPQSPSLRWTWTTSLRHSPHPPTTPPMSWRV